MVLNLEWKLETNGELNQARTGLEILGHPVKRYSYTARLDHNREIEYAVLNNGLGERVAAYARSIPGEQQKQLIAYMAYGRLAFGLIPEGQPPFSHRLPEENDTRAQLLSFIAEEISPLLPFYQALPMVHPGEIVTLKEIVKRNEHFRAGKFTDEDRRLFWGYDNRWRWNQVPLDPNAPETVSRIAHRHHGVLG